MRTSGQYMLAGLCSAGAVVGGGGGSHQIQRLEVSRRRAGKPPPRHRDRPRPWLLTGELCRDQLPEGGGPATGTGSVREPSVPLGTRGQSLWEALPGFFVNKAKATGAVTR